jgi:hypothetical protein
MSDLEPASESEIEQVSASWLASQEAGDAPDGWVENWQDERYMSGDCIDIWRFVLKLCEDVAADDGEMIGMIGAGPLWAMFYRWPDRALALIEAEATTNQTLLKALSIVLTDSPAVRDRINAILGRDGEDRP